MRKIHKILVFLLLPPALALPQASRDSKLSTEERALTATTVYSLVQEFFDSNNDPKSLSLNAAYKTYLRAALVADDRRQFDLATIEFVAQLHSGHTFFWDTWLDNNNQPMGFYASPLDGYWVVQRSSISGLKAGDILVRIDNTPMDTFFQQQQRYVSASSVAAQLHNLFLLPYLFPQQFTLTLDGDRKVLVDREKVNTPGQKTEGHWLKSGTIAYIRIPVFSDPEFEIQALEYVRQFQNAKTLIIDLRDNAGGISPKRLIRALMNRPYRDWKKSTTARFAVVDADPDDQKERNATLLPEAVRSCKYAAGDHLCSLPVSWGGEVVAPDPNAFRGRVVLLVDGGCVSACEELVEPFKNSGRGTLVGETTEGSSGLPYVYDFHSGMILKISVTRQYFPDGSEFEGVGIKPDFEVQPSSESLKSGHDVILERALELAGKP